MFQDAGLAFSDGDRLTQTREGKNVVSGSRRRRKGRAHVCAPVCKCVHVQVCAKSVSFLRVIKDINEHLYK